MGVCERIMKIILETKSMWDALRQLGNDAVVISLSMQYRGVFPTEYRGCAITSEKMCYFPITDSQPDIDKAGLELIDIIGDWRLNNAQKIEYVGLKALKQLLKEGGFKHGEINEPEAKELLQRTDKAHKKFRKKLTEQLGGLDCLI